jgi:hypothetical protein
VHDNAENDRRDEHRDQLQERIAEEFESGRKFGRKHSDPDAQQQADDHLRKSRLVQPPTRAEKSVMVDIAATPLSAWMDP